MNKPVKILSAALIGLDSEIIEVEADNSPHGMPGMIIVGLADKAVDESKSRVRSAIKNSDLEFPRGNVVVNLAPADLKKAGTHYDLPIAIACLAQSGKIIIDNNSLFVGELALDGTLRQIPGVISFAIACREQKIDKLFLPEINAAEAALIDGAEVYPVRNLTELIGHLRGETEILPHHHTSDYFSATENFVFDLSYVKGQDLAKRALEISAAGSHNFLMSGPPGSGKTLLAKTLPSIMPKMTIEESLEATKIYSSAGLLPSDQPLITSRPFRSPHHSASAVSLVGGGSWPKPGEISLAHRGVLFLDEFLEFPKMVLENLRQPLEDGLIHISRANGTLRFPAKFILAAAMNPCPCGYLNDPEKPCLCSQAEIIRYQKRASGPLMDRIDLHLSVPRIKFEELSASSSNSNSLEIRQKVQRARDIQIDRFKTEKIFANSEMSSEQTNLFCVLDDNSKALIKMAVEKLHLSPRAYFRILKVARTIADLAENEKILTEHLAEALQYRPQAEI